MSESPYQQAEASLDAWTNDTRAALTAFTERLEALCDALDADEEIAPDGDIENPREIIDQAEEVALLRATAEHLEAETLTLQQESLSATSALRERDAEIAALRAELSATREAVENVTPKEPPTLIEEGLHDVRSAGKQSSHRKRLGERLIEAGAITEDQLAEALFEQTADAHRRLGDILVELGWTSEEVVAKILASQLDIPYSDLEKESPIPDAVNAVSKHLTELHHAMPLRFEDGALVVAMTNPLDLIAIEDLEIAGKLPVKPVIATPSAVANAIARNYA